MRVCTVLFLVFGFVLGGYAQGERALNSLRLEADKFYEEEQYNLAAQYYRELADHNIKDAEVSYRLADCYLKTFNYSEAEVYFLKVHFLAPDQYPLALYHYALMLKYNANFEESIQYFDEFVAKHQNDAKLKDYVEQALIDKAGSEIAREELKDAPTYKLMALNLNTPYNDYAPAVRDSSTMVITSGRIASNRQSIDERFGEAFTDNFYFEKQSGAWQDKTKALFAITNTKYNDGSGSFNSKGDKYYFTVCGMDGPQCKIFVTTYKNNKWSEPVALNNNINYRTSEAKHPAISHGGDTLVFSSNRGGGFGKFDLWMSIDAGEDNWGPAMNLGNSINTKLNELTPTFTAYPNVIFFASDGHEGYGGLDLYMAKKLSTGETLLFNLDQPFNSNRDDCFASFSEHELYWSSNRSESTGGFDIVGVKIPSVIQFISKLSLKKRNARRDINLKSKTDEAQRLQVQASRLEEKIDYDKLSYEKKQIVEQMIQNRISNNPNAPDQFKVSVSEFQELKKVADERYEELWLRKNGYLTRVKSSVKTSNDLLVTGVLADSVTGNPIGAQRILLTDSLGEVIKITRSNDNGKFRFTDVSSKGRLYLRLDRSSESIGKAVIRDLSITGSVGKEVVHVENIYFDFDHYRIRPEAAKVLDELAQHLIKHPAVQVEIFAFADDRGTNDYNLKLTQKRGQSVVEYLAKKGVDQTGLAIVAKGKQEQKEVDVDLQRQYNRRVEFYLNGNSDAFAETSRTYILKKKSDWAALAQVTGVSKEELKLLNGATAEEVSAFQPVRVPLRVKLKSNDLFFSAN
jgi:outer membrane protein OmpA-like peptidoglycan-associated protein